MPGVSKEVGYGCSSNIPKRMEGKKRALIYLIQEPWVYREKIKVLSFRQTSLLYANGSVRPAFWLKKNPQSSCLTIYTVATLEPVKSLPRDEETLWYSVYLAYDVRIFVRDI